MTVPMDKKYTREELDMLQNVRAHERRIAEAKASSKENWAIAIAVIMVVAIIISGISFAVYKVQGTSRQNQQNSVQYRTACIEAGKSVINGNCIKIAP